MRARVTVIESEGEPLEAGSTYDLHFSKVAQAAQEAEPATVEHLAPPEHVEPLPPRPPPAHRAVTRAPPIPTRVRAKLGGSK